MNKADEYRRHARDAQELTDKSLRPSDKAAWLRIAQSWLRLLRSDGPTPEQRFDEAAKTQGTGQDDSDAAH